jgi:hypothetical protein
MTNVVIDAELHLFSKFMSTLPQLEAPDGDSQSGLFHCAPLPAHDCEKHGNAFDKNHAEEKKADHHAFPSLMKKNRAP